LPISTAFNQEGCSRLETATIMWHFNATQTDGCNSCPFLAQKICILTLLSMNRWINWCIKCFNSSFSSLFSQVNKMCIFFVACIIYRTYFNGIYSISKTALCKLVTFFAQWVTFVNSCYNSKSCRCRRTVYYSVTASQIQNIWFSLHNYDQKVYTKNIIEQHSVIWTIMFSNNDKSVDN